MKALKIDTEGKVIVYDGPITLKVLQEAVGGLIEPVALSYAVQRATMYINEDGKSNNLPANTVATYFAALYSRVQDTIVGDAIVVGPPNSNGDDTSLDDFWLTLISVKNFELMT